MRVGVVTGGWGILRSPVDPFRKDKETGDSEVPRVTHLIQVPPDVWSPCPGGLVSVPQRSVLW